MKYKPKRGWLYAMAVLCVLFGGVMVWSMVITPTNTPTPTEAVSPTVTVSSTPTVMADTPSAAGAPAQTAVVSPAETAAPTAEPQKTATKAPVITTTPTATPGTTATKAASSTATAGATATRTVSSTATPTATATVTSAPTVTATPEAVGEGSLVTAAWLSASASTIATRSDTARTVRLRATPAESATPAFSPTPTVQPTPTAVPTPVPTSDAGIDHVSLVQSVRYTVDFTYLQTINPDIKGWLVQDGTSLNYPILQGTDDSYYLRHLYNRNISRIGSVCLESDNSSAFSDTVIYLRGNETDSGTIFSSLVNYTDQAYYEEHPQMILLTPYGDYCIDLFAGSVFDSDETDGWRLDAFSGRTAFADCVSALQANSFFQASASAAPEWGDQLVVMVTNPKSRSGRSCAIYGRMRRILYAMAVTVSAAKMDIDSRETVSGWEEVPGKGEMMVYAQNDPLWTNMRYENRGSAKHRTFGNAGCGPTSVAMAVVNLVPKKRLADICEYAESALGFSFNATCVNEYYCSLPDAQYQVQTADEYLRYFPLVMAGFATGNNLWGQVSRSNVSGTSLKFLRKVAYLYKLDLSVTSNDETAADAVRNGAIAVQNLGEGNPFTGGGHYVVLASADDEYAYYLDPYRQENYDKYDEDHLLTCLAPGVARVKLDDIRKLHTGTSYILSATALTASSEPAREAAAQ